MDAELGLMEAADCSTFSAHVSLAVLPGEQRIPLGVLAMQPFLSERGAKGVLNRGKPKLAKKRSSRYRVPREEKSSFHWDLGIDAVRGCPRQPPVTVIHVCDREADDFRAPSAKTLRGEEALRHPWQRNPSCGRE
jgi:hypothetical protein